jgi:hypothetical protein
MNGLKRKILFAKIRQNMELLIEESNNGNREELREILELMDNIKIDTFDFS